MTGVEEIVIDVDQLIAQIYQNIQQNPADWKARRDLILQLGEVGHGLSRETQLQVFQLLLDRCNVDDEDEVRGSARDALRLIWLAEWDTRQQVTLDQVLLALTDEMSDGLVRQQAADFIRLKAIDISKNDRMVDDTLEALISRANFDRDSRVKLTAWDASRKIWEAGWSVDIQQKPRQLAVFNRFLNVLREKEEDRDDWEVRKAAVDWLLEKAGEISGNDQMANGAINTLIARSKEEEKEDVRKLACTAIRRIWDEGWRARENEGNRQVVLEQVLKALNKSDSDGSYWKVRETAADWLAENSAEISRSDRMVGNALADLTARANDKDENSDVRRGARMACQSVWNTAWSNPSVQESVLNFVLGALNEEEDDTEDREFRQPAAQWVGDKAGDIAGNDRMVGDALKALIERANEDQDEYTRRSAEASIRKLWEKGWDNNQDRESRQLIVIDQVLKALRSEGKSGSQASKAAIDWIWDKAGEVSEDARMVNEVIDALILAYPDVEESVRPKALDTMRRIWDGAWGSIDRQVVLELMLDALKKEDTDGDYRKVREAAADWLGVNAKDITHDARMTTDALNVLYKRLGKDEKPNVRRSAREGCKKIWDAGWIAPEITKRLGDGLKQDTPGAMETKESRRLIILGQVMKAMEKGDDWEFQVAAINWVGDNASELVEQYDLAEKVANKLGEFRNDKAQKEDLKESAQRAILAIWDALRKKYPLEGIKKRFDEAKENEKIDLIRKFANENTLGSREAVNFLVGKWVEWIYTDEEKRLVEIISEKIRITEHAILPLVEHFVKSRDESQAEPHHANRSRKTILPASPAARNGDPQGVNLLRVRRRIARQLADMSDPRIFEPAQSTLYESILQEMRDHTVPVFIRQLPEEKDVEVLENIARALLYCREREGIDSLAKEVVGEERTRKSRQELLATYYLEPSKARSDQAADILRNAIDESKRTLRILQVLNIMVVIVGLAVLFYGLYYSIMGDDAAGRIIGGLAAIGGLTGVIYQLIREPLNRIQNASSNLVQMETAFTSFIWELNLNGTFIQSSYVNRGELSKEEINDTDKRIEAAMRKTMNLVSIYTGEGKQRLVTRINNIEPVAGKAGSTEITIYGQYLKGDSVKEDGDAASSGARSSSRPVFRLAGKQRKPPAGMVAIDHIPISAGDISSWDEGSVRFVLPAELHGSALSETVWISLFVDGMETNALPFHVVQETSVTEPLAAN